MQPIASAAPDAPPGNASCGLTWLQYRRVGLQNHATFQACARSRPATVRYTTPHAVEPALSAAPLMIVAHAVSDTGRVRTVNEDSVLIDEDMHLYAVADGMGGHNAGEVASKLALEALAGFIRRSASDTDLSWPYGVLPDLSFQANRLRTALYLANRRVFRAAESRDDYTGMGTTVVSVLINDSRAVVAHVGDSRVYRLSKDGFAQVTRDDSWAAALQSEGLTIEDLSRHPMRHVLTNVVGARDQVEVHVQEFPIAPGDRLLLCSDGLHEPLGDERMAVLLRDSPDATRAAAALVQGALDRGSRDNVTALVVAVEGPQ